MSSNQDQARLIADRVARNLAGESHATERQSSSNSNASGDSDQHPRARIINFVSSAAPQRTQPSITQQPVEGIDNSRSEAAASPSDQFFYPQVVQSPWLAPFARSQNRSSFRTENQETANHNPQSADHPSEERFGVEEAAVSELVEFFENEKQCSVDPSGKPCDHCAMCSSRGF